MTLPSGIMTVTGNWSSEENRGKFTAAVLGKSRYQPPSHLCFNENFLQYICYSSFSGGLTTSYCLGSYLFGYIGRYLHWKYIFHLSSFCGILWTVCWYLLVFDSPNSHPTISEEEKIKIQRKRRNLKNDPNVR